MTVVKIFPNAAPNAVSRPVLIPPSQLHTLRAKLNVDLSNLNFREGLEATQLNTDAFKHEDNIYCAPGRLQAGIDLAEQLVFHEMGHVWERQLDRVPEVASGLVVVPDNSSSADKVD